MSEQTSMLIWRGVALLLLLLGSVLVVGLLVGGPDLVSQIMNADDQTTGLTANLFRIPVLILGGTAVLTIVQAVLEGVAGR